MKRTVEVLDAQKGGWVEPGTVLKAACRDVAEHTNANRVSIWHFSKDEAGIECDCLFEVAGEAFSSGHKLMIEACPKYFQSIKTEQLIVAPDARNHPITKEFAETYFRENDIHSLLDLIIHDDFRPVGVLCCENTGAIREWREEDISYLRQMATLISFYFKRD